MMESMDDDATFPLDTSALNRYFIQLISCGDDYQFQELIKTFLPILIRTIEVQTDDFRKKAVEVFIHINKRVKTRPEIQIPVQSLLEIFTNSSQCSPFASNFSIMYIKLGFMRLKPDYQVELIPLLFQSLPNRTTSHQELLLGLVVYALQHVKIIPNMNENTVKYGLVDQPTIRHLFLNFLLNVILLPYKFEEPKTRNYSTIQQRPYVEPSQAPVDEVLFSTMDDAPSKEPEVFKQPYPCMNEKLYNRIIEAIQTEDLDQVEKLKVGILKFLNGNIYHEDEVVFHFVLATADSRYSVVLAAEHDIKRLTVAVDWNSMQHVQSLFEYFLGTSKIMKQQNEEMIRNPSNTRIRLKLYPYLLKSRTASTIFPHAIQILYESLFGNSTNARIKYLSLQFTQNIIQNAEINNLNAVSKLILNALEKILNTETNKTHDASRLRSLTYVLIGKLSYRVPKLFGDDIRLTQQFFEALKTEDNECCLNIQEALNLLSYSQKDASVSSKHMLQQLLTQQVIPNPTLDTTPIDYPQCRQAAVSYVMNVFPSNDCTSRFILLTACSDKNEDIRSLASRNLFSEQDNNYPDFQSLLKLILSNAHGEFSIGRQTLVYHPQTYQEMIYYLHRCLIRESFNGEKNTPLWKYEEKFSHIYEIAKQDTKLWYNYIQFLLAFVLVVHDTLSTYFLLESVLIGYHLNDQKIIEFFKENLSSFRQLCLYSTRDDTRRYASILYGYILSKKETNSSSIEELIKIIQNFNQRFEQREGSILALGYVCSYLEKSNEYINTAKELLLKIFFDNQNEFIQSLLISIGQLARMNCFNNREESNIRNFIEIIKTKIRSINETNRIKEKAIQTLGFLAVCYRQQSQDIIDILTQTLVDTKQIELQLNIGDALICCILGVETPLVNDPYRILDENPSKISCDTSEYRSQLIKYLLNRILHYSSDIDNPHSRQASLLWLLTFLIHCRRPYLNSIYRTLFESKLFLLQTNLIYGLLDQDELSQELSCKCLIYIYEIIENNELQFKFNNQLFEHFTDSTRSYTSQQTTMAYEYNVQQQQTNIDNNNTQIIFYKELCSLVDLISIEKNLKSQLFYSFLYLAHENSIWSTTRYGQLFHLNDYEKKSIDFILVYIEQFISRLYRLLYDPQIRIQECIKRIWNKLFPSIKQILIVEKYFSIIFIDLYNDILSSRWRIRESIQLALLDIFRMLNRRLIDNQQYIKLFQDLFKRLLTVCDDTKESVRKAALTTINAFKQNCLLLACDPATTISNTMTELENKARGRYVLEQVLPVLLNDGLYSKNEDIAKFSLNTIIEIIRYGDRDTLKPYCVVIIIALFEALSSIEPDIFNYASMKLSAAEMKEQIDIARILCARSSPIMDAINTCTNQFVDENILDDLSGKLIETIKHSVGITTKCVIGQYFITLTNLYPKICSKYVGKWMAVLVNTMSVNSNRTLRKTYTSVLGTIVRIAKRSSIENLLQKISTWYYQTDNDYQYVCALTLNSISQSNQDLIREYGQQILPLIFLAMQEKFSKQKTDDEQQEELIWKNLWIENTGSSITGIQIYMKGIIDNIRLSIEHSSYTMKIKGARAIQMIGETLKNNLSKDDLVVLVEFMLKGLYGRVYEGKECFLRATETICINCKDTLKSCSDLIQRIYESILKECKKESLPYRSIAIRVLSLLADEYNFQVYQLFWTWFEKAFKQPDSNEETEKLDVDEDPIISDAYHRTLIECLGRVWPKTSEIENQYKKLTFDLLIETIAQSNWQIQLVLIQSLNEILQKSSTIGSSDIQSLIEPIINLGPRTKASGLKREILKFLKILFENSRYSKCFYDKENLRHVLNFNIEEMIHDNRSNEISEQAKEFKKQHEHLFVKTKKDIESIQTTNFDSNDLF